MTLTAIESEIVGGELKVSWQTGTETDNVGFELWGRVDGTWRPLSDLIASRGMNSDLPQNYETTVALPEGLTAIELVDYDTLNMIAEIMFEEYRETRYAAPPLLKRIVSMGRFGRKTGLGFYDWSGEKPVPLPL